MPLAPFTAFFSASSLHLRIIAHHWLNITAKKTHTSQLHGILIISLPEIGDTMVKSELT